MNPVLVCRNEELGGSLGLSVSGDLMITTDDQTWELFDFNAQYAGYYPSCRFTAIACCSGLFYAAAVAPDGLPWVFSSLMGGVWGPVNLISVSVDGGNLHPTGKVLRILYDVGENQVFLICENGELVTLPDCPRCIKVKRVTTKDIADAWIDRDSKEIVMHCGDGTEYQIPLREAVQYRATLDYIKQQLVSGGYLVDVRGQDLYDSESVENSVCVPLEDLPDWLEELPRNTVLAFFCQKGIRSDKAADYARRKGFSHAYSLGGLRDAAGALAQQPL